MGMKILAFVLAGGEGTRLRPLTARIPKPALPFAGRRIIDFALSNLVNSGIDSIYVVAQYKRQAILEHVQSVWSPMLLAAGGFAAVLLPEAGPNAGFVGTADSVYKNMALIERHRPDLVAVFAADQVYRMDVAQMAAFHVSSGAAVTVAALPMPSRLAKLFGGLVTDPDGRVENPEHGVAPLSTRDRIAYASMDDYIFDPGTLLTLLEQAHRGGETDFTRDVLPRASRAHSLFAYDFSRNRVPGLVDGEDACYWRDIGTDAAYQAAQRDTLGPRPRFRVDNPSWPIYGALAPCELRDAA